MVHEVAATELPQSSSAIDRTGLVSNRLVGFLIVAVLPAGFWTTLLWLGCAVMGWQLSGWSMTVVAAALVGFLGCIWASFAMADSSGADAG